MLKPVPLASALAAITVAFYVICWIIFQATPGFYNFLINAYSFGANVAEIFRPAHTLSDFVVAAIVSGVTAWLAGYAFAWLYNRWSK